MVGTNFFSVASSSFGVKSAPSPLPGGMTIEVVCGSRSGRTLTPTPLPVGEGLKLFLLPSGEGGLKGRMRVRTCANSRRARSNIPLRAYPHPNPSPGGRGAQATPSPPGGRWPERPREGTNLRELSTGEIEHPAPSVPSPHPLSRRERGYSFSRREKVA